MAILEKEIFITLHPRSVEHYENIGYEIPRYYDKDGVKRLKRGTKIKVRVSDLSSGSNIRLTKVCDNCNTIVNNKQTYTAIIRNRKNGKDYCMSCSAKYKTKNYFKKKRQKEKSFLWNTDPDVAMLLKNKEDGFKISRGMREKVDFICPDCGEHIKNKQIQNVVYRGLSCPKCSDGISYPEKFMYNLLNQLGIDFEYQKTFKWLPNKRYDFYIPSLRMIIETHGQQHTQESAFGRTLKEERENDRVKKYFALKNKIVNYIPINCSRSNLNYIKGNIISSNMSTHFDLSEINWENCHKFAISTNLTKEASNLWNQGMKSTKDISEALRLSRGTITKYLKFGAELGWCDYKTSIRKGYSKKVVQLSLNGKLIKEWDSILDASTYLNINSSSITSTCNDRRKTAGGFRWMYKDRYSKENIISLHNHNTGMKKEVVQLSKENGELIKIWESIREPSRIYGNIISDVCKGKRHTAGGYRWMYRKDYEKYIREQNKELSQ